MKTYEVCLTYEEYFIVTVEVEEGLCPAEVAIEQIWEQEPDKAHSGEFQVYKVRKNGETVWEEI
jgi:hypothetical protein